MHAQVESREMCKVLRIQPAQWRDAFDRRYFRDAPPVNNGRRLWDPDSMIPLQWFIALTKSGMKRPLAGRCAAALAKAMQAHPDQEVFGAWFWPDPNAEQGHLHVGLTPPPHRPDAELLMTLPISLWRERIAARLAEVQAQQAGKHAPGQ